MNIIEIIKDYISIQKDISKALIKKYNTSKDFKLLFDFPDKGEILVVDDLWEFQKHGAGFRFINKKSQAEVDIHIHIDIPDIFDAHKISNYLESITRKEVSERKIKELLENELVNGKIGKYFTERGCSYKLL